MTTLFGDDTRGATISEDEQYRYDLWRRWDAGPTLAWIMLNPSTADALIDDATIRKIVHFTGREGFGSMVVRNLYAFRSPYPKVLRRAWMDGTDVVGPENDSWLRMLVEDRGMPHVVLAWGAADKPSLPQVRALRKDPRRHSTIRARVDLIRDLFADADRDRLWRLMPHEARGIRCSTPHPVLLDNDTPFAVYRP